MPFWVLQGIDGKTFTLSTILSQSLLMRFSITYPRCMIGSCGRNRLSRQRVRHMYHRVQSVPRCLIGSRLSIGFICKTYPLSLPVLFSICHSVLSKTPLRKVKRWINHLPFTHRSARSTMTITSFCSTTVDCSVLKTVRWFACVGTRTRTRRTWMPWVPMTMCLCKSKSTMKPEVVSEATSDGLP